MARILMVNDEPDLLELCRFVLEQEGHEVAVWTDGCLAAEYARKWRPDLIITDWVMPDMDGHTLLSKLKSHLETREIPVLLMSALRDGAVRAEIAGADAFLPKPFGESDLVRAVTELRAQTSESASAP